VANKLSISYKDVTSEQISSHITNLSKKRGSLSDTVICIYEILFRKSPKFVEVRDLVGVWIRRKTTLTNILYSESTKCYNKRSRLDEKYFDVYCIKKENWKSRKCLDYFQLTSEILEIIFAILPEFNNPVKPKCDIIKRSRPETVCLMLSS